MHLLSLPDTARNSDPNNQGGTCTEIMFIELDSKA